MRSKNCYGLLGGEKNEKTLNLGTLKPVKRKLQKIRAVERLIILVCLQLGASLGAELAILKPGKSQAKWEKLVTLQVKPDDVLNYGIQDKVQDGRM